MATFFSLNLAQAAGSDTEDLTALTLEELLDVEVISASRFSQKTNQAATSISVLTADDIRTFGWRTLADALNSLRGLYTSNDRNYTYLGVRGFSNFRDFNSRTLVMIDGLRMNENVYDTANIAQEFMLDIDLVERIEFIPGSGSSIYGNNAFLGLINVVTKKGRTLNGAQISGEAGRFGTYKARASYGKQWTNGTEALVSASHYGSDGVENLYFPYYDHPETNHGIAHNVDAEHKDRVFGKLHYQDFTASGGYVERFKRVPTAPFGQIFNDPLSHTVDRQLYGNLAYQKDLTPKSSLRLSGFYQFYDYWADDPFDLGQKVINHDQTDGRWWGGEALFSTQALARQRLLLGVEYQYDDRSYQLNYDVNPHQLNLDKNFRGSRLELLAQDDISLLDNLVFSAGVRFDHHHLIKDNPVNPRLGLIYNPTAATTYKLLYSASFRAPNAAEKVYNNFYFGIDQDIQEERIHSYEAIAEWRPQRQFRLMGSVFHNHISRFLQPADNRQGPLGNLGEYRVYGAEWEAEQRWKNGRLLKASYTFNFLSDQNNHGQWGIGSPQNLFKIHYAEPLWGGLAKLGLESIYIGDRKAQQGGFAEAYNLINVTLVSDKLVKGTDFSASVYDLLDTRYQVVGGDSVHNTLNMNGREFRVKITVNF